MMFILSFPALYLHSVWGSAVTDLQKEKAGNTDRQSIIDIKGLEDKFVI